MKQLKIVMRIIRRYPFTTLCVILVWGLSLTPYFPETPFNTIDLADKWTHFIMYGGTALVMWWEYWRRHRHADLGRLWLCAGVGLSLMGGLLELLQAYYTTTRSGEWLDFVADSIGAVGVCLIGTLLTAIRH